MSCREEEIEKVRREVAAETEARLRKELEDEVNIVMRDAFEKLEREEKRLKKQYDDRLAAWKREKVCTARREAAKAMKMKMEEKMEEVMRDAKGKVDVEKTCAEIFEMRLTLCNQEKAAVEMEMEKCKNEAAEMKAKLTEMIKEKDAAVNQALAEKAKREAAYELMEKTSATLLHEMNNVQVEAANRIDEYKRNFKFDSSQRNEIFISRIEELTTQRDQAIQARLMVEEGLKVRDKEFYDLEKLYIELKKESDTRLSTIENQKVELFVAQSLRTAAVQEKEELSHKLKEIEFKVLQMRKAYERLPWMANVGANGMENLSLASNKGKAIVDSAKGEKGTRIVSGLISDKSSAKLKGIDNPLEAANVNNNNVNELGKHLANHGPRSYIVVLRDDDDASAPRSNTKSSHAKTLKQGSSRLGGKRKLMSPKKEPATKARRVVLTGRVASTRARKGTKLSRCLCSDLTPGSSSSKQNSVKSALGTNNPKDQNSGANVLKGTDTLDDDIPPYPPGFEPKLDHPAQGK